MDANPNTRTKNTSRRGATLIARIIKLNGKDLEIVASQQWMCVYTKAGAEFNTASICMNKGVAFFVPLLEYSDRIYGSFSRHHSRQRFKPLWPRYIFCRLNEYQKVYLRASPSVVRLMKVADEHELLAYLKQFTSINKIVPCGKNDPVVFRRGLFGGMLGKVEEILEKESMFKIAVEMLGSIQHLKVGYDEVTPVWGYSENVSFRPVQVLQQMAPAQPQEPTSAPLNEIISQHLDAITAELIKHLAKHPNLLYQLEPRRFEMLIAELLNDMGYDVELTPQSRDGGRDILAALNLPHGKILTLVECKRFSPERKVGIDIVERFLWVLDRKDKASCGLIATTSDFSSDAIETEKQYQWRLSLKNFDGLREWLKQYGTWKQKTEAGLWVPDSSIGLSKK